MKKKYIVSAVAGACALCALVGFLLWQPSLQQPETVPNAQGATPVAPQARLDPTEEHLTLLLDYKAPLAERIKALRAIKRELAAEEVAELRTLVRRTAENATVRNDVLSLLERQPNPPDDLSTDLIAIWRDRGESAVIRDYALQHLAHVMPFDAHKKAIEDTLIEASKLKEGTFPGTAMLSMNRISSQSERIRAAMRDVAVKTTLDENADRNVAVTAMQVARAAGDTTVLDRARELAAKEGELVRLRMSSINTLGELGRAGDLPLLEKLTRHREDRISRVAKYSLKRLKKKLGKPVR